MMVYKDNPFNSSKGKVLLKEIFNLMFIGMEGQPSKIETKDKDRQVSHYRGNIVNIVNKMRKFVKGYQQVTLAESNSSGIHVCPSCRRRDAIWMWETVDAGHYSSALEWLSSVSPSTWDAGTADEKGRYQFVVRYRCNDVTTCNNCHITVAGKYSSCQSCNSSDVSKVGCGEESFATHFIREYTANQNIPQTFFEQSNSDNFLIKDPNNRRNILTTNADLIGYEYKHTQAPKGKVIDTWDDIKKYVPSMIFTYGYGDTDIKKDVIYPLSEMNYAISKQNFVQCVGGKIKDDGTNAHGQASQPLADAYNDPVERCRLCQSSDFGPLQEVPNKYYRPHPMKIMNAQPLEAGTASGGTYKNAPVYNLYLESPVSDSFKLLLPLAQQMSLRPIPNEAKISAISSGSNTCPNDVGGEEAEQQAINEANKELMELQEKQKEEDDKLSIGGYTNKGFTYDVCEGRSRKAYYDSSISKWIDDSPPCKSFRKDGETLTKIREYPRWSEIPDYSPNALPDTFFNEYLGPDPETQLIMDWIKCNQSLAVYMDSAPTFHTIEKIASTVDEDIGMIYSVYECRTCRGIVEAGGIINWRKSLGECDENGIVIDEFSQDVLNREIAYEKSYPTVDVKGNPVTTAWGLVASKKHDGKKMLENPDLNIRIG